MLFCFRLVLARLFFLSFFLFCCFGCLFVVSNSCFFFLFSMSIGASFDVVSVVNLFFVYLLLGMDVPLFSFSFGALFFSFFLSFYFVVLVVYLLLGMDALLFSMSIGASFDVVVSVVNFFFVYLLWSMDALLFS